jgi:hypothetical protein
MGKCPERASTSPFPVVGTFPYHLLNEPWERPGYGIGKQRLDQRAGWTSGRTETEGHQCLGIAGFHAMSIN